VKGFTGAAIFALLFAALAAFVVGGCLQGLDRSLLLALRNGTHDPAAPQWIEIMFLDLTALGSNTTVLLVTLAAAGFLAMAGKRGTALLVLVSAGGGTLLNNLLKLLFSRPRPDLVAHSVEVQTTSFPSGHAMLSAIVYLTIGALLARTQKNARMKAYILALSAAISALIGTSRVYLGVHWPTDVLAGWLAGGAWAMMCWEIARRLQEHGDIEKAGD